MKTTINHLPLVSFLFSVFLVLTILGCGGSGGDDSSGINSTSMPAAPSASVPNVRGVWSGRAFLNRVDCDNAEFEDFNFDFGVNQNGTEVLVSYENFCDSSQDETGFTTADGFSSRIEKTEGCGGGIEALRVDSTELSQIQGDTAEVTIRLESTCPEAPCFREWIGSVTRSSAEQFNCQ